MEYCFSTALFHTFVPPKFTCFSDVPLYITFPLEGMAVPFTVRATRQAPFPGRALFVNCPCGRQRACCGKLQKFSFYATPL